MANHKSAAKRARQTITKTVRTSGIKSAVRTIEKKLLKAITDKKTKEAQELLIMYSSKIGKAAQKGIYHQNTASRKSGRLTKQVSALK